jgi:transcriptional regulator with XRE-family HTH domain
MTFGHYLRETRRGQQMPLTQFAERVGISAAELLDMECNRRSPSYTELKCLAAALERPEIEVLQHAGIISARSARTV